GIVEESTICGQTRLNGGYTVAQRVRYPVGSIRRTVHRGTVCCNDRSECPPAPSMGACGSTSPLSGELLYVPGLNDPGCIAPVQSGLRGPSARAHRPAPPATRGGPRV